MTTIEHNFPENIIARVEADLEAYLDFGAESWNLGIATQISKTTAEMSELLRQLKGWWWEESD